MKLTNSPLNRRSCATSILLGAGLVLAVAAGLAHSAPLASNSTDIIFTHLTSVKRYWEHPCSAKGVGGKTDNQTSSKTPTRGNHLRVVSETLQKQINQSLIELKNWRAVSTDVDWNNEERKKMFSFLAPFKQDKRKAYNKLSVYWASLEMISFLSKKDSATRESTIASKQELEAIDEVQTGIHQLLCQLEVYNSVLHPKHKPVGKNGALRPKCMAKQLAAFNVQDPNELRIHIWYVMCRLNCFLTSMEEHVVRTAGRNRKQAQRKGTKPTKAGKGGKGAKGGKRPKGGNGGRKAPCDKCPHRAGGPRTTPQHTKKPRQTRAPTHQHTAHP